MPPPGQAAQPTQQVATGQAPSLEATPQVQPPPVLKPGILIVTLHEGKGLSLPQTFFASQNTQSHHSVLGGGGFSVAGSTRPGSSNARVQQGPVSASYSHGAPIANIASIPTNHGRYASRFLPYALLDFDKNQIFVNAVSGSPESPLWAGENTSYKFDVSRPGDVTCQIYLRNPNSSPGAGRNEDLFLGACRITPRFEVPKQFVDDPKASRRDREKAAAAYAGSQSGQGQSGTNWIDLQFGTGSIKVGIDYVENQARTLKMEDFELLKVVGKGSFGKVMQVR
jgi:serum/glucocorticoid-regulated kinase 2